jgi:Mlc titration factor MtfA (ptsG expression regulator)
MQTFFIFFLTLIAVATVVFIYGSRRRRIKKLERMPEAYRQILQRDIVFYQNLSREKKTEFENRMMRFLSHTRITGVKTQLEDIDQVYIAASAIIPIFGFPWWEYTNLNEVLVYPDAFDHHEFRQEGHGRNTLGVVGDGPYHRVMILSQKQLRVAFTNTSDRSNTPIHEFVHLIDKSDGTIDGIPEAFLDKQYIVPWMQLVQKEIGKIIENRSDIDPYGAHNEAEFFAVVSEYFFERPDELEQNNRELYQLLVEVFKQRPGV